MPIPSAQRTLETTNAAHHLQPLGTPAHYVLPGTPTSAPTRAHRLHALEATFTTYAVRKLQTAELLAELVRRFGLAGQPFVVASDAHYRTEEE